jgi:hypothetical protein
MLMTYDLFFLSSPASWHRLMTSLMTHLDLLRPFGARAYDVTAVLTFSAAAARGALARGVCLDELSTKHSIRPDF